MRAALGVLRDIAAEVKTKGTYYSMADAPSHAEVNGMMEPGSK
jgi:hypothetical protein